MLKNQVGCSGNLYITEEVNCYAVWEKVEPGYVIREVNYFHDVPSKDKTYQQSLTTINDN